MILPVNLIEQYTSLDHSYTVLEPDSDTDWQTALANEYVRLRTACAVPLEPVTVEGIGVFDTANIQRHLQRSTIPFYKPGNFNVVRSDFGEVAGYMLLAQLHQTKLGYMGVCHRETIQLPGRGIDIIGIEHDPTDGSPLTLVLGEVKVSDSSASPPAVVDAGKDCMRVQHLEHTGNVGATRAKLWNQSRQIPDLALRNLFFAAALILDEVGWKGLRLVSCCVLVRPRDVYTSADFGSFRKNPTDFAPAGIRFLVLCVPGNIDGVVQSWFNSITALAKQP